MHIEISTRCASLGVQGVFEPFDFPEITGEFIHYRQEDVTADGVMAAHGLPLHMSLVGELNRVNVGAAEYMDCTAGALDVEREPWPANTGFTIWLLHSGNRVPNAMYNGPALHTPGASSLTFCASNTAAWIAASFDVMDSYKAPRWAITEPRGPETLAYHKLQDSHSVTTPRFRLNGEDRGAATGGNVGKALYSNGPVFTIGGRRDEAGGIVFSGLQWKDVVLKVGGDFEAQEIIDLEKYAASRIRGLN